MCTSGYLVFLLRNPRCKLPTGRTLWFRWYRLPRDLAIISVKLLVLGGSTIPRLDDPKCNPKTKKNPGEKIPWSCFLLIPWSNDYETSFLASFWRCTNKFNGTFTGCNYVAVSQYSSRWCHLDVKGSHQSLLCSCKSFCAKSIIWGSLASAVNVEDGRNRWLEVTLQNIRA